MPKHNSASSRPDTSARRRGDLLAQTGRRRLKQFRTSVTGPSIASKIVKSVGCATATGTKFRFSITALNGLNGTVPSGTFPEESLCRESSQSLYAGSTRWKQVLPMLSSETGSERPQYRASRWEAITLCIGSLKSSIAPSGFARGDAPAFGGPLRLIIVPLGTVPFCVPFCAPFCARFAQRVLRSD